VERFSLRRFVIALIAFVCVLTVGTLGFHQLTDEGWTSAFYRSVVSTTLTGSTRARRARGRRSSPSSFSWRAWQSSSTSQARSSS
jgi:hypothetical protein